MTRYYNSHEVDKRFDPAAGVGIQFKCSHGDAEYVVLPPKLPREVQGAISTWQGYAPEAVHYYGKFEVCALDVREVGTEHRSSLSCQGFPEEADHFTVEVKRQLTEDEFDYDLSGKRRLYGRKGGWRDGWKSVEDLIKVMELEFDRIFGDRWELISGSLAFDSWEEYKRRKLYMWGEER